MCLYSFSDFLFDFHVITFDDCFIAPLHIMVVVFSIGFIVLSIDFFKKVINYIREYRL